MDAAMRYGFHNDLDGVRLRIAELQKREQSVPPAVVALIGGKNVGKSSTLKGYLDEESGERIPTGTHSSKGTQRFVLWIPDRFEQDTDTMAGLLELMEHIFGHQPERLPEAVSDAKTAYGNLSKIEIPRNTLGSIAPANLNSQSECFYPVRLPFGNGDEFLLMDTPGSGDETQELKQLTHNALLMADYKVMVVSLARADNETVFSDVSAGDGSVFIPVFRLDMEQTVLAEQMGMDDLMTEANRFLARWKKHLPSAIFTEPLLLPDLNAKSGSVSFAELGKRLQLHIADQLLRFPRNETRGTQRVAVAQIRAQSCLRDLLREPLTHIQSAHGEWVGELQKMSRYVIDEWVSNAGGMETYIRWKIRNRLVESLGFFSFPVRTVWSGIALTNGVWDRIFLALNGSLFSLLSAAGKTSSNLKTWWKTRQSVEQKSGSDLEAKLINRMIPAANRFSRDLTGLLVSRSGRCLPYQEPQIKISGLGNLGVHWEELLAKELRQVGFTLSRWLIGPACVLFFWFLVLAQLFVLYGNHLPFAFKAWTMLNPKADSDLLLLPAGLWTTTFLLALVPAVVSGIFLNSWTARKSSVEKVSKSIGQQLERDQQTGKLLITVEWLNPQYQAAQRLITFTGK